MEITGSTAMKPSEGPRFQPLNREAFERASEAPDTASPCEIFEQGAENSCTTKASAKSIFTSEAPSSSLPPGTGGIARSHRQWTVLYYANGNCDLQQDIEESVKNLESMGSDDRIAFAAQVAHGDQGGTTERILLKKPTWMGMKKNSEVLENLGSTNMAHPQVLKDFISWGMKRFPAEHYAVILSGHGMGFIGSMPDEVHDDILLTPELKSALDTAVKESGRRIDILGFDSCLMANAETAYAARDAADFLVGSEEVLVSGNWDYRAFAEKMKEEASGDGLTVGEALEAMVKSQYNGTLLTSSIIDCRQMPGFAGKLKDFSEKLLATPASPSAVRRAFREAQHYCQPAILAQAANGDINTKPMDQMRDVISLALSVMKRGEIDDGPLKSSARDLAKFIADKVVIFEMHRKNSGLGESSGMSLYAPAGEAEKYADYYSGKISLGQDTGWGKVIRKYGL
ncbi:MAG: clostripain-related cysteine peptidase [Candidatus Eremiobacteraeota bacterium]|nr:clostripain-related cysteine peptidase [Candidatus Eremiobacteraeota bacterium]